MAANEIHVDASPEQIFGVLSDADAYADWVVGSEAVGEADRDFPAAGSRFHHRIRFGPLTVEDHTRVVYAEPPRILALQAKARPLGTARVTIQLHEEDGGTRVRMVEDPGNRLTALLATPFTHLVLRGRNDESLRRLKRLSESRAGNRIA